MKKNKLAPGQKLGEFSIVRFIQKGGMGEIYEGFQENLQRKVALKVIRAFSGSDSEEEQRFIREARILAKIQHPNIVQVITLGSHDEEPFLVMEFVEGKTLRSVTADIKLSTLDTLNLFLQILAGVSELHRLGILHRDLKTENIMILAKGRVKILDFGIAKIDDSSEASLTSTGMVVGTLQYVAPELIKGEKASAQTDIWSLGVIFAEMLLHNNPFRGANRLATIDAIKSKSIDEDLANANIDSSVVSIVKRMLKRDKQARYQNVDEIIHDFRNIKKFSFELIRNHKIEKLNDDLMDPTMTSTMDFTEKISEEDHIEDNLTHPLDFGDTKSFKYVRQSVVAMLLVILGYSYFLLIENKELFREVPNIEVGDTFVYGSSDQTVSFKAIYKDGPFIHWQTSEDVIVTTTKNPFLGPIYWSGDSVKEPGFRKLTSDFMYTSYVMNTRDPHTIYSEEVTSSGVESLSHKCQFIDVESVEAMDSSWSSVKMGCMTKYGDDSVKGSNWDYVYMFSKELNHFVQFKKFEQGAENKIVQFDLIEHVDGSQIETEENEVKVSQGPLESHMRLYFSDGNYAETVKVEDVKSYWINNEGMIWVQGENQIFGSESWSDINKMDFGFIKFETTQDRSLASVNKDSEFKLTVQGHSRKFGPFTHVKTCQFFGEKTIQLKIGSLETKEFSCETTDEKGFVLHKSHFFYSDQYRIAVKEKVTLNGKRGQKMEIDRELNRVTRLKNKSL